jgi:hypothetical protein
VAFGGFERRTDLLKTVPPGALITTGPYEFRFTEATAQHKKDFDGSLYWEVVMIGRRLSRQECGPRTAAPYATGRPVRAPWSRISGWQGDDEQPGQAGVPVVYLTSSSGSSCLRAYQNLTLVCATRRQEAVGCEPAAVFEGYLNRRCREGLGHHGPSGDPSSRRAHQDREP